MKTKNISILIVVTGISLIVIGFLLQAFMPNPNHHLPRPNPYFVLYWNILLPVGIAILLGGILIGVWRKRQ